MNIRVLGIPLDLGQARRGVDMGPSAVRAAGLNSALRALGHHVEDAGNIHVRIAEEQHFGDKRAKYLKEIAQTCREAADRVYQAVVDGWFPISLGGDHSIAVGTHAGISRLFRERRRPIGCIWIDAHADMNTPETSPSGNIHGMPFAASLGFGPKELTRIFNFAPKLRASNCALVGLRDVDRRERRALKKSSIHAFTMRDIDEHGLRAVMERSIAVATNGTAGFVVSLDMDVVDPREAPGVGTPVPGGITFREAHLIMEMISDTKKMLELEIVEVNPIIDVLNRTAALAVGLAASALGKKIL
ncbi:MAG TPA: arginase [Terriglobia bacterium]|nr:arginase [Terriglobia bacterium]